MLTRYQYVAIAALGVVLYAAADHFATFAYAYPSATLGGTYNTTAALCVYWLRDILAAALIVLALRALHHQDRPDLAWRPTSPSWCLGAIALGVVMVSLSVGITQIYYDLGIHGRSLLRPFYDLSPIAAVFLMGIVGIVSPIVQEVVFRGWVFSALRRALPLQPAVVLSALAFSLMHTRSGLPTVTHTFVFGCVAAFAFERSRSIVPSSIMHVLLNSVSTGFWLWRH